MLATQETAGARVGVGRADVRARAPVRGGEGRQVPAAGATQAGRMRETWPRAGGSHHGSTPLTVLGAA